MHLLLLFISSLAIIILISSIFAFLFNKKIGFFVPLSIMIIVLTYYVSGLVFNSFNFVKYLLYIYIIIGVIFVIKYLNKNTYSIIFTKGLLLLIIIYVFVFIYCYKYNIAYFDEFYHWSPMVRSMFINNKFYSVCGIEGGAHIEYPPFFSLIELFYCRLYGSFSESVYSIGMHITSLSFFIVPYVDVFDLKRKKSFLFSVFYFLVIVLFSEVGYFRSTLIDVPLAFIASFPLIIIFSKNINNKYGKIYYGVSLGCLLLTKQLGIVFYVLNLLLYIVLLYKDISLERLIKNIVWIIFVSMIVYLPWVIYVNYLGIGVKGQFSIINILSKIFTLNFNDIQLSTISRIGKAIIFGNMLKGMIYIPCVIFYLFIIGLYFAISYCKKTQIKKYVLFDIVAIFIFFFCLTIVYCFSMEENEMLSLNNFFRYVTTFNIFILLLFILSIREYINNTSSIIAIILLLLVDIPNYKYMIPRIFIQDRINDESTSDEIEISNYILTYLNEDSNYLIVSDYNFTEYKLKYLTNYKRKMTKSKYLDEYLLYSVKYDINNLIEELKQYDYVIFSIEHDDILFQLGNDLKQITNSNEIYNCIVYEINKDYNDNSDILLYMLT